MNLSMSSPWTRRGAWILALVVLGLFPLLNESGTEQFTRWIPLAVAGVGLNLLTGFNGQVSIGHGAFFGLGAYACGIWVNDHDGQFVMGFIVAIVLCFLAGAIVGLPALRIRGLALALMTIAVGTLFPDIIRQFERLTGGSSGLAIQTLKVNGRGKLQDRTTEWVAPGWTGISSDQWRFYIFASIAVICLAMVAALIRSRTGRALIAIRDNEVAAETNGIAVDRLKVITFGLSAALAGIGGAMFALIDFNLTPDPFNLTFSLNLLVIVVIGGSGTILGPVVGALSVGLFNDVIVKKVLPADLGLLGPVILGVTLVLSMQFAPSGTVGSLKHSIEERQLKRRMASPPAS